MTAIATQSFSGSFVKSYYVSYGDDGINWMNYTVQGRIKVFKLRSRFNIYLPIDEDYHCFVLYFILHLKFCILC